MNTEMQMHQKLSESSATKYDGGTNGITITKSSSSCLSKYVALIFSFAALTISIIVLVMVFNTDSKSDDALNIATSSRTAIGHLSRNAILSQFSFEQRIRSEGSSGITNTRQSTDGDKAYDQGTFSNGAVSAIHDHADFINIAGMGEVSAVLNGVEFQTRHNDYNLEMASTNSTEYGVTEVIPMPDVPPSVLSKITVNEQITEMQEWFRAFKTQNKSHRNYPLYFKPILCYLEGTWIIDEGVLEEPFDSDRHSIDASTWKELHDKIRYMINSGRKDRQENFARLPSSIRNLINDIYPVVSNWEYRILCHPLKNDVPTKRFKVADDLSVQLLMSPLTREELYYSRRTRFKLSKYINLTNPDGEEDNSYPLGYWLPGVKYWNYLDYLMEQIPGKDNYLGNLTDEQPGGINRVVHYNDKSYVNSAYYNRYYSIDFEDAMGTTRHRRSYNDRHFFAAQTSQSRVSPVNVDWLLYEYNENGTLIEEKYEEVNSRFSYAIPLEIIYTTPLIKWNPYNITYFDSNQFDISRTGSCDDNNNSYIGWTDRSAYYTPSGFYSSETENTPADSAESNQCALDSNGISQNVFASGHWITFPRIGGNVGYVRQRYPIPPIHGLSNALHEIKALQDILLDDNYDDIVNGVDFFGDDRDRIYGFDISLSGGSHLHILNIPGWKVNLFWYDDINGQYFNGSSYKITADTDIANGHEHTVIVWRFKDIESQWNYVIDQCAFGTETNPADGTWRNSTCIDGHYYLSRGFS